ncbi:MAG: hypothetical protein KJZ65_06725 [Phycisphaerales bacterium]|nr:hypothetical protein [Phycisphaerales bacterium]
MAEPTTATAQADVFEITIDGAASPYHVTVAWADLIDAVPITSGRTGSTPLDYMVQGVGGAIEVTFNTGMTAAQLQDYLNTDGSGVAPVVGDLLTRHTVLLHPVNAGADDTQDFYFPAMVYMNFRESSDGLNERRPQVTMMAVANTSGEAWQLGAPA